MSKIDIDNNVMCYIDSNNKLFYADNDFLNPMWTHIGPPCISCAISNGKIVALPYIENPEKVANNIVIPYFYFTNNYKSNIWKQINNPISIFLNLTDFDASIKLLIIDIEIDNDNIIVYGGIGNVNKIEYLLIYTNDNLAINDSPVWRIIDNRIITSMSMSKSNIYITSKDNFKLFKGELIPEELIVQPGTQPKNNTLFKWADVGLLAHVSYISVDNNDENMIYISQKSNEIVLFSLNIKNQIKLINNQSNYNIVIAKISNNKILCYSSDNKIFYADTTISNIINLQQVAFTNLSESSNTLVIYSNKLSLNSIIAKISMRFNISPLHVKIGGGIIIGGGFLMFLLILFFIFRKSKPNDDYYNDDDENEDYYNDDYYNDDDY